MPAGNTIVRRREKFAETHTSCDICFTSKLPSRCDVQMEKKKQTYNALCVLKGNFSIFSLEERERERVVQKQMHSVEHLPLF